MKKVRQIQNYAFTFMLGTVMSVPVFALESWDAKQSKATDVAAMQVQEQSIKKLKALAKKSRGTPREPLYLSRLADLYLERSGISFRISEGDSLAPKKKLYANSLNESIDVLSQLVDRYPNDPDAPYARFKRAKAYKELKNIPLAKKDYLYLRSVAKNFEYLDSALIDLADFATEANEHREALIYLGEVEQMKGSEYYPLALHRTAWSYFNLADFETALNYLKRECSYYFAIAKKRKNSMASDEAFVDSAMSDAALFYFEAINKKSEFANALDGIEFFRSMDPGKRFGPTVFRFAKLLKAYALIGPLAEIKTRMIDDELELPETVEVTLLLFQYQFEQKNFKFMEALLGDLKKIRKSVKNPETDARIDGVLSKSLADLHKLVLKEQNTEEGRALLPPLRSITQATVDLFGDEQTTSILARFALAETEFQLKNYAAATDLYHILVNPDYKNLLESKKLNPEQMSLRLVSSRYREIQKQRLVPDPMVIRSLQDPLTPIARDWDKKIDEWGVWLADHGKKINNRSIEANVRAYESFQVEYLKLRYEFQNRLEALDGLFSFGKSNAETTLGVTAMKIMLDTYGKTQDWEKIYDTTQAILDSSRWKDKEFTENVFELSAQSYLKMILASDAQAKTEDEFKDVRNRADRCLKKFGTSKVASDCALINVRMELKAGSAEVAEAKLSGLVQNLNSNQSKTKDRKKEEKSSDQDLRLQSLLLMRADARSRQGKLDGSTQDLLQVQRITGFKDPEITANVLQQLWFKRDEKTSADQLNELLKEPKVCSGKNVEVCDRFRVIKSIDSANAKPLSQKTLYQKVVKGEKAYAALWALTALKNPKSVAFNDRLNYLIRLSNTWSDLNPLLQIQLIPLLHAKTNETLSSIRQTAPGISPLNGDPESVIRRLKLTSEVDQCFAKVMKLPWLEIKLHAAKELGEIYLGLLTELSAIATPADLLKPFQEKVQQLDEAVKTLEKLARDFSAPKQVRPLLTSEEVKSSFSASLWNEWTDGVAKGRGDYLFYLIGVVEGQKEEIKNLAPVLRGLILVDLKASTEGHELIQNAPTTPLKEQVLPLFTERQIENQVKDKKKKP
jgi:hypothetical protein